MFTVATLCPSVGGSGGGGCGENSEWGKVKNTNEFTSVMGNAGLGWSGLSGRFVGDEFVWCCCCTADGPKPVKTIKKINKKNIFACFFFCIFKEVFFNKIF